MDSLSAGLSVVAIVATLVSPVLGVYSAKVFRDKGLRKIPESRRAALEGCWKGRGVQNAKDGGEIEATCYSNIRVIGREVHGELVYEFDRDGKHIRLEVSMFGGFLYDRYLRLQYDNKRKEVIQFGAGVLELSPEGVALTGCFVGFGSHTREFVGGEIVLEKVVC
ncbi:hypothetical protein [Endothiovibrio diazotrophicus]